MKYNIRLSSNSERVGKKYILETVVVSKQPSEELIIPQLPEKRKGVSHSRPKGEEQGWYKNSRLFRVTGTE